MYIGLNGEQMSVVCESEQSYISNRDLQRAWDLVEMTDSNLFLTGRAGTGKTTFLKKLRNESAKRMVVLAPTGVAAINASGTTIHSFFQLPFSVYIPGKGFMTEDKKFLNISRMKKRLIMSLSLLVIDEISMVRPDMLDAVDAMLRRIRSNSAPFGGVQLLLIGDLRQLPPVVREDEWNLLKDHYDSPYFYESHALKKAGFKTIELTTVYRQNDAAFLSILNAIRDGKATDEILQAINRRHIANFNPDDRDGYIRLTTHNRFADNLNLSRLGALTGEEFTYDAKVEGKFPESSFPAEKLLRLKQGAQVMFIKNDIGADRKFYNGMIGRIESISEEKICVRPIGGSEVIEVTSAEWEITRYELNEDTGKVMQVQMGIFRQYPLQLAWAVTIHKSQGLTFERAIIDAARSFAPGQTYVALSRCRSLEGLVLESPLPAAAVIADTAVNDFIDNNVTHNLTDDEIEAMKRNYAVSLMHELLDFSPLDNAFNKFFRLSLEFLVPIYPEIEDEFAEIQQMVKQEVRDVSMKFLGGYTPENAGAQLAAEASPLRDRLKKGSSYFYDKLNKLSRFLRDMPKQVDNAEYAERLESAFSALQDHIFLKMSLLGEFKEIEFSVEAYLDVKARATLRLEGTPRKPSGKKEISRNRKKEKTLQSAPSAADKDKEEAKKKVKKPKGYSTFETLRLFRDGHDLEAIARERKLGFSTIAGHIVELIQLQKVSLQEVVDATLIEQSRNIIESHPDIAFSDWSERLDSVAGAAAVPSHIKTILWKTRN